MFVCSKDLCQEQVTAVIQFLLLLGTEGCTGSLNSFCNNLDYIYIIQWIVS